MCTSITLNYDGGSILARTLDYEVALDYNILYQPADFPYSKDLNGQALHSKYRTLGIIFYDHLPLKDGVNEHGLMGCTNLYHVMNLFAKEPREDKINLSSLDYFTYALSNYKNLDELLADLDNIHISQYNCQGEKVICPDFHYMFTDRSNRCVVIEPKDRKLQAIANPYNVMTNSPPFSSHVRRLHKTMNVEDLETFKGAKNLPGGYDPVSRFIKSFFLTKTHVPAKDRTQALSAAYSIMEAMKMPQGFVKNEKYNHHTYTRYICAYDNTSCLLTARSHTNPLVYSLSFDDIQNPNQPLMIPFQKDFEMSSFIK